MSVNGIRQTSIDRGRQLLETELRSTTSSQLIINVNKAYERYNNNFLANLNFFDMGLAHYNFTRYTFERSDVPYQNNVPQKKIFHAHQIGCIHKVAVTIFPLRSDNGECIWKPVNDYLEHEFLKAAGVQTVKEFIDSPVQVVPDAKTFIDAIIAKTQVSLQDSSAEKAEEILELPKVQAPSSKKITLPEKIINFFKRFINFIKNIFK